MKCGQSCGNEVTHTVPAWKRAGLKGGLCTPCAEKYRERQEWRYRMHLPVPIDGAEP